MTHFSGMSWNGGTKIDGDKYSIRIMKERTTLKKRWLPRVPFALMLAVGLDSIPFVAEVIPQYLCGVVFIENQMIAKAIIGAAAISLVAFDLTLFYLVVKYFRGCQKWHGLEHKLIAAAEAQDIDHAKEHSPINDRCGATFIPSLLIMVVLSYVLVGYVFGNVLHMPPFGAITLAVSGILLESRYWHTHNMWGIRFGRWIQRKFTVQEPTTEMIEYGILGMKTLIEKEGGAS